MKSQIASAEDELDKKQAELTKERLDHQTIVRRDPRLAHWQRLSLPEDKNQEQELKAGRRSTRSRSATKTRCRSITNSTSPIW